MAIREIRQLGDPVLRKKCKEVQGMTPRISQLIEDMLDTMYEADGVGLAAPQVGVLKRIVVIDVGEGPLVLVNPKITETSGEQVGTEGCLSLVGKCAIVKRPDHVVVEALDRHMIPFTLTGEGLLARAICHECDHLDGIMYVDVASSKIYSNEEMEEEELSITEV